MDEEAETTHEESDIETSSLSKFNSLYIIVVMWSACNIFNYLCCHGTTRTYICKRAFQIIVYKLMSDEEKI